MSSNISLSSITDEEVLGNEATSFLSLRSIQRHYEPQTTSKIRLRSLLTPLTYMLVSCLSILLYEVFQRTLVYQDRTINLLPSRHVLPVFPHNKLIRFTPNESYYGEDSLPTWWALNAQGGGLINIENGPELGLGPSLKGINGDEGYGISVFHQVHCMAAMRQEYQQALWGNVTSSKQTVDHVEHCFDYIRQVLMCHADLGLEHESSYAGQIDGWGTLHQCRDWDAVIKFVEDNRVRRSGVSPGGSHQTHHG